MVVIFLDCSPRAAEIVNILSANECSMIRGSVISDRMYGIEILFPGIGRILYFSMIFFSFAKECLSSCPAKGSAASRILSVIVSMMYQFGASKLPSW